MSSSNSFQESPPGTFLSIDVNGSLGPFLEENAPDTSAADETYRRRLQHILSNGDKASTTETIPALLKVGAERLGVENGHLAEVDPAKGTHRIVETSGPHPVIEEGTTTDLSKTYCRKLLAGHEALAVWDAAVQGWDRDPAYEAHELEAYVGAKIVVEEDLFGTVCFVGSESREAPLDESDETFLELVTGAISRELRRRWREEQGRRTRARLEALFEGSPDMIHVHDLEGSLLEPNPRLLERTGYEEGELVEMKMWDLDESLDADEARGMWEKMEPGDRRAREGQYRRKDGTTFPVEVHLRRLSGEETGRFVAVCRDVTERKKRERALRREKERFESLVKGVEEHAIYMLDPNGCVQSWNPGAEHIKGYSEEEVLGEPFATFYTDEDRKAGVPETNLRVAKTEGSVQNQGWRVRKDGSRFWADITLTALREKDGTLRGFAKVTRDLTGRKKRERKVQRLRRKYKGLLKEAPDPIFVADAEGQVQEVNEAAVSLIGSAREDLEGRPVTDFHPAGETAKYEALFRRGLQAEMSTETTSQFEDGTQLYLLRKAGGRVPVEVSVRRVELDGDPHLVGIYRDITDRLRREGQLERLNDLFEKAEELAGIGAWEYDPQTDWLWWTDQTYEIYGLPTDTELTTEKAIEAYHPADRTTIREAFERAINEGVPYDEEVRLQTPGGETRWVRAYGETETEEGEVIRAYGTIQDITDRIEREESLREAKEEAEEAGELFRSVFENAPVMIDVVGEDGRIEMINDHFEEVLGFSKERVRSKTEEWLWEKFYPDPKRRGDALESVKQTPEKWTDFCPQSKDGEKVDSTWTNVELSGGRRLGIGLDIRDRKRRQRRLKQTNSTLKAICRNLPMGVLAEDDSRQVLAANDRLCEIFNLPMGPAALEGGDSAEVARYLASQVKNSEEFSRQIEKISSQDDPVFDEEIRLKGGRILERDFVPYEIPQGTAGLWVYQDVTERKRREEELLVAKKEAETSNRLKTAMLANMNHEIRTPLTSVMGFADILREELGGQMGTFAEQIHASSERLMRTLDSVLRLSKLESEIEDIERVDVDLSRMTRETAELLRPSAEEKQVALETKIPAGEVRGKCNEGALDRILENLIENAIKFTSEGGTVTVRLREAEEKATLEVEDTGVGIAEPAQEEIFEAFQQESDGLGREFEGSGLGLSIVERLVEAHGGSIEVESKKGVGTRFTVRLPKT